MRGVASILRRGGASAREDPISGPRTRSCMAPVDRLLRGLPRRVCVCVCVCVCQAEETRQHAYYRPVKVRPWVLASLGRPGEALCADLRRLARERMRRGDVARAVSVPSAHQLLLQRWRAELSCALVMGDAEVYMAALDGRPSPSLLGGIAPADVEIYDLRSCRIGSA
eukprot:gene14223-biopygen12151